MMMDATRNRSVFGGVAAGAILTLVAMPSDCLAQLSVPNGDFEQTETVMLGDPCLPLYTILQPTEWDSWYDFMYDDALIGSDPEACFLQDRITMTASADSHGGLVAMQMETRATGSGFSEATAQTLVFTNGRTLGPTTLPTSLKGFYKMSGGVSSALTLQAQLYLMSGEGELDLPQFLLCRQTFLGCPTQSELIVANPTLDLPRAEEYTAFEVEVPALTPEEAASVWVIIVRFRMTGIIMGDEGALSLVDDLSFGIEVDCPGDFDGSGDVGFADLTTLLSKWGPCRTPPAPCPWDLDGSGDVGFTDLTSLLARWGPC